VSIILLDWGVRESLHSIHYLNAQSVPRTQYELIWVEFYNRKPPELAQQLYDPGSAALDKWLVLGYPAQVRYHKHRMYNAGIVLAEGDICVFCDSDAIFLPTFVESIIKGFEKYPNGVLHLDEVRNYSKRFYPFNYPALADVLGEGCSNWTGGTTTGLDNSPDMIHTANYGACMAARRQDLIAIGGADEHIDYLGYICGPYELTFRLVNFGREEHWLRDEYLYHVWHPNTSGCNIEHKGPDDGRGMSLTALQARDRGQVQPLLENPALRSLREGKALPPRDRLALLLEEGDEAWLAPEAGDDAPRLVQRDFDGFNIYCYRGNWYALICEEGAFDPVKVVHQDYRQCFSAPSKAALMTLLAQQPQGGQGWLIALLRRLPLPRRVKSWGRDVLGLSRRSQAAPRNDGKPHLIEEGYRGYNILYYRGSWYGLGQNEGAFDETRAREHGYQRCISGNTILAVRGSIRREQTFLRRLRRLAGKAVRLVRSP
jgi:hypothetical protein